MPNHWQAIKDAPHEFFQPMPFILLMDWKIGGWEIPQHVECIVRFTNLDTHKVTEHTYQRRGYAEKKVQKLMSSGNYEFVVADHDEVHYIYPTT